MITTKVILLVLALICLVLAAFDVKARVHPGWVGLALWVLAVLIG